MKKYNCESCLFCSNSDDDTGFCTITECLIDTAQEACNNYQPIKNKTESEE